MIWFVVLAVSMKTGAISRILEPVIDCYVTLIRLPQIVDVQSPEGFLEIINGPDKAIGAGYWAHPEGATDPNSFHVIMELYEPYPAEGVLNLWRQRFSSLHWRKLDFLLDDPNLPASVDWAETEGEEAGEIGLMWREDWINGDGDAILLRLTYLGEPNKNDRKFLLVDLWLLESSCTRELLDDYKNIHSGEMEQVHERGPIDGRRLLPLCGGFFRVFLL